MFVLLKQKSFSAIVFIECWMYERGYFCKTHAITDKPYVITWVCPCQLH